MVVMLAIIKIYFFKNIFLCNIFILGDSISEAADREIYSNEWVVEIDGSQYEAEQLAINTGFTFKGKVLGFNDHFVFHKEVVRNKREISRHTKRLSDDSRVKFVEHQIYKKRTKRDFMSKKTMTNEAVDAMFNDPYWPKQWPLHDTRTAMNLPKLDLRVLEAWKKNFTGSGVIVSIIDDGIQWNHTDLIRNYDPQASYDINGKDNDPMPTFNEDNKHGTRCAGEVAMMANNHVCGVGLAYNAKIGGIRLLDGKITDKSEAEALQYNIQHIDIFSASWGPNDDGQTVEGPGRLALRAIKNGIANGRNGKGTIYVWASGNGGTHGDNCDCDGYADSIYTLSVSSASQSGHFPWYGEKCASTIATTYSSGTYTDQTITTTDVPDGCTTEHTGTSASAPLAAAIIALGLEANSNLTWRDMQHISVWTSEPGLLTSNPGWHTNGRGLQASTRFGFGLMNAESFVTAAESWIPLPKQKICRTTFPKFQKKKFGAKEPRVVRFKTDACQNDANGVKYLEHVLMIADIEYNRRGNLAIYLISPSGTRTKLLSTRSKDASEEGFRQWPFMSVHSWGEDPSGFWRVEVFDENGVSDTGNGTVKNVSFVFYGTTEMPAHYKKPRQYQPNYNNLRNRANNDEPWNNEDLEEIPKDKQKKFIEIISDSKYGEFEEDFVSNVEDSDNFMDLANRRL